MLSENCWTNEDLREARARARKEFEEMADYIDLDFPLRQETLKSDVEIEQLVMRVRTWFAARDYFVAKSVLEELGPWASIVSARMDKYDEWEKKLKWCKWNGQCSLECPYFEKGCTWYG